jgi:hypothetical protein
MSIQDVDDRTRANMEAALERACALLPPDRAGRHTVRCYIAESIFEAVRGGQRTLTRLTVAGRQAATDLATAH